MGPGFVPGRYTQPGHENKDKTHLFTATNHGHDDTYVIAGQRILKDGKPPNEKTSSRRHDAPFLEKHEHEDFKGVAYGTHRDHNGRVMGMKQITDPSTIARIMRSNNLHYHGPVHPDTDVKKSGERC